MDSGTDNALPILNRDLAVHLPAASSLLQGVKWLPNPTKKLGAVEPTGAMTWRESSIAVSPKPQEASVIRAARKLSKDDLLLNTSVNQTLNWVRTGMQIGSHLASLYVQTSNLEILMQNNKAGRLNEAEQIEFREKLQTASAIFIFAAAYYVDWELSKFRSEEVSSVNMEFAGIPEISLKGPVESSRCLMYYYAAYLENSGIVQTELDFLKLTLLYFRAAVQEVVSRVPALKYIEAFTQRSYKLEGSEFDIHGFKPELGDVQISVEFNRVDINNIVGNRDAKHAARRLATRLMCYDPASKRNPIRDLGGLATVSLGYGKPGTGKSLQIAATATMLDDMCKLVGIPFLFHPLPDSIVSTFQGGSAERMVQWFKPLADSSKIIYAPIDDAENNLEDRTRQGVSAGVREVIAVFLRHTEGAYAVHHGNSAIELFTNIPEQIDPAVMSRIVGRTQINGAESFEDFVDQDHLWWNKYDKVDESFVDMDHPVGYTYLSAQALLVSLSEVYEDYAEPKQSIVRRIYQAALKDHSVDSHAFFGALYVETLKCFPNFSSRDVRNIQRAIDGRIMDFDFPEDWLQGADVFFLKTYEEKMQMIKELMRSNMSGLSFAQIRLQEAIRYLDNLVVIAETGRRRKLKERVDDLKLHQEALETVNGKS